LLRRYAETRGLASDDRRLAQVDLAFHDITTDDTGRPRGLFRLLEARGAATRLTSSDAVERALVAPPHDTRAVLRGRLIRTAQAEQRRYSVDWSQFTAHDLPQPDGTRDDRTVRLTDPLAVVDERVDDLLRALSSSWTAPAH
jgi:proteasome accessory factor A